MELLWVGGAVVSAPGSSLSPLSGPCSSSTWLQGSALEGRITELKIIQVGSSDLRRPCSEEGAGLRGEQPRTDLCLRLWSQG